MARRLNPEQWVEIKTKYQLGDGIRALAREYDITDGAIRAKIKSENWTQELRTQVSEIASKVNDITQNYAPAQIPIINERLRTVTDLMRDMNTFIGLASKMNIDVMLEAQNMDTVSKTMVLSKLKGSFADLANMVGIQKEIATNDSEDENSLVTVKLVD